MAFSAQATKFFNLPFDIAVLAGLGKLPHEIFEKLAQAFAAFSRNMLSTFYKPILER